MVIDTRHTILALLAIGGGILGAAGCVRVDREHCAWRGGDQACDSDEICVVPTAPVSDEPVDELGCHAFGEGVRADVALKTAPNGHVRAPFGLPQRLEAQASSGGDLQSLEGVLAATLRERGLADCEIDLTGLETWPALSGVVRDLLEQRSRVRTAALILGTAEIEDLEDFNREVLERIAACGPPSTGTDTDETGTDTDGTDSATGTGTDD
ncbi:MAG: hypothetical protein KDK70_39800, partial [Myxococcales bacterium]|nr:hypothetical protein [Myxococcales bacterium]